MSIIKLLIGKSFEPIVPVFEGESGRKLLMVIVDLWIPCVGLISLLKLIIDPFNFVFMIQTTITTSMFVKVKIENS